MRDIRKELESLSNKFTDKKLGLKCRTDNEKDCAHDILTEYYDDVDCKKCNDGKWFIKCCNLKPVVESLNESDFDELDDPDNDMDLSDENLDSIDDASEVEDADKLTVLKARAADLAKKYLETIEEMTKVAKELDLSVERNDDLTTEIKKANGEESEFEDDLAELDKEIDSLENHNSEESEDDDFGPSEYDDRAKYLATQDREIEKALKDEQSKQKDTLVAQDEEASEVDLSDIDDDF